MLSFLSPSHHHHLSPLSSSVSPMSIIIFPHRILPAIGTTHQVEGKERRREDRLGVDELLLYRNVEETDRVLDVLEEICRISTTIPSTCWALATIFRSCWIPTTCWIPTMVSSFTTGDFLRRRGMHVRRIKVCPFGLGILFC